MANHHHQPEIDPTSLKDTQKMWDAFVQGGKYTIVATCLILIGLALAFVKFT